MYEVAATKNKNNDQGVKRNLCYYANTSYI